MSGKTEHMTPEGRIQLLAVRIAQAEQALTDTDATDVEVSHLTNYISVLRQVSIDIHRRDVRHRAGTLNDWVHLANAIRACNRVMTWMRAEDAAELKDWKLSDPQNPAQHAYSFLYTLLLDLGQSSVEIEDLHPEMDHYFADYREMHPPMGSHPQI